MKILGLNIDDRLGLFIKVLKASVYSIAFILIVRITLQYSSKIAEFLHTPSGRLKGLLTMLFASIVFLYFKNKQQFWYGIFQTAFGLIFTFVAFKVIIFKIAGDHFLKSYSVTFENFHIVMPLVYLFLIVFGISNSNDGWKKDFYFKGFISRLLIKIYSLEYGRKVFVLLLSFIIIPSYYICYLSFQDDPVEILKRESYVREATNQNDHPRIAVFNQSYHMLPANASYCGTSIEWAVKKAGWELDVDFPPRAKNWSEKPENIIWSGSNGAVPGKTPTRNDVVVCFDQGNWHVGLLEDWQERSIYCKTIEANTSDRDVATIKIPVNKEGIYQGKLRNKKDIYCVVRPYYLPYY